MLNLGFKVLYINYSHNASVAYPQHLLGKGEEAINYYTSLFPDSKIKFIARDEQGKSVLHCQFSLAGTDFVLMEGPGDHKHSFNNSLSFVVNCETQAEVDEYWDKLSAGGSPEQCGWLKDKYGISWQIVPTIMGELMADPKNSERAMKAMLQMKKIDIQKIKDA